MATNCNLLALLLLGIVGYSASLPLQRENNAQPHPGGSEELDEPPTLDSLWTPDQNSDSMKKQQQGTQHDYLSSLYQCLKRRDSGKDLKVCGCVPNIFSSAEEIPQPTESNTVLSFISMNSTVGKHSITSTFNISRDPSIISAQSFHLRIYKEEMNGADKSSVTDVVQQNQPNECTVSISASSDHFSATQMASISYTDLAKKGWLDINLQDENVPTSDTRHHNISDNKPKATLLNLTVSLLDCVFAPSLEDIGVPSSIIKDHEPALIVYANKKMDDFMQELLANNQLASLRTRRQQSSTTNIGSGIVPDPEKCRLINYNVPYPDLDIILASGYYELNYCTGQCLYPLAYNQDGAPYYHSVLLAIFQVKEFMNSTSETSVTPPPCCVPTKYAPITLPIKESEWGQAVLTIENATAKKCGCR